MVIHEDNLIEKAKANDLYAFQKLVEMYHPLVQRFAYQIGNNFQDIDDITQEVFLKVYRFLDRYQHTNFSTWLYKITLNVSRDFRRKHSQLNRKISRMIEEYDDEEHIIETLILKDEEDRKLHYCIQQLKEKYRVPLILYFFHDKKYDEIADILGLRLSTVKTRLLRSKRALKEIYEMQETKGGKFN